MKKGKASHHGTSEREDAPWGQGQFANMPTEVIMSPYPIIHPKDEGIDDTISRLDEDSNDARTRKKKTMAKGMY